MVHAGEEVELTRNLLTAGDDKAVRVLGRGAAGGTNEAGDATASTTAEVEADEACAAELSKVLDEGTAERDGHTQARERLGDELTEARVALGRWQQQADALVAGDDLVPARQPHVEREYDVAGR